jgi:tRNA (cytidine/uridine-2'-O-)-methyltransferase
LFGDEIDVAFGEAARFFVGRSATQARGTNRAYWDVKFRPGDFLIFGRETKGLAESVLAEHQKDCITIPMAGTRSLNLATAVGIVLFEAIRQQQEGKRWVE